MRTDSYLTKVRTPKGDVPKGEMPGKWQGLTVTFKDNLEKYSYREQFNRTAYRLCRHLGYMCSVYEFYPEFTDTGRIHYHGRYKPKTKHKALQGYEELRKYGFIKIETNVKDMNKWLEYIRKDYASTKSLIKTEILINPDFYFNMLQKDADRIKNMEQQLEIMKRDIEIG